MAREGREERPVRPEREHAIGKALYNFSRETWGTLHKTCISMNLQGDARAQLKAAAITELNGIIAQINAL